MRDERSGRTRAEAPVNGGLGDGGTLTVPASGGAASTSSRGRGLAPASTACFTWRGHGLELLDDRLDPLDAGRRRAARPGR